MKLSVIIPTCNRAGLLEKALKSLLYQTMSPEFFEVIVVDNGSTDNTLNIVNSFRTELKNLRYFYEHQPGLHVGRHKGCIEAESNLLVYADDDIEAFPTWLQAIEDSFEDEAVVIVGGKCLPKFEGEPPSWVKNMWLPNAVGDRTLGFLSLLDLGDETRQANPRLIYGCNFAIRRSVLLEAGGFHPDAMPKELIRFRGDGESHVANYIQSKGYKALYNPLASIYHWVPQSRMTAEYFCRRAYSQGISDSYSAIRLANGVVGLERSVVPVMQPFYLRVFNMMLSGITGAVARISSCLPLQAKWEWLQAIENSGLRRKFINAYQHGYDFHQAQIRESPDLLSWVLRTDYWSYRLPSDQ